MRLEIYGVNNLNFVELNITGDTDSFHQCDKDSKYIDTEVYNLFSECFENSSNIYDYFGPTKYNSRNIVILLNELNKHLTKIQRIDSFENFIDFTGDKFLGANFVIELDKYDKNWRLNWGLYQTNLISINEQLIELVNQCITDDRTLWLIGY
jgi:hypothetical protein